MNQPDFSDYHSIIYGHNMRNTTMFGDLKRYKNDEGFYENNQYFNIYTDTQVLRYQIFSYYDVDDQSTAPQVAAILNEMRRDALNLSPLSRARMLSLRLSANDLLRMYYKYIGVLGGPSSVYRFEAVWHGRTVRTVVKEPVQSVRLECVVHNPILTDGPTWDCAAVSLRAIDQNGNLLPYCGEAVQLSVEGPVKILGPAIVPLRGGMAGTYLATTGEAGRAVLHCRMEGALDVEAALTVRKRSGAENAN